MGMSAKNASDVFDITVIGGGPSGLFGAFYAGLRQMKTKIIDSLPDLGGQLSALYPDKYIYDFPGYPRVLAKDLVETLVEQTKRHDPTIVLGNRVVELERVNEDLIKLVTGDGAEHFTRTALVCGGVGAFRPRTLKLDGVDDFEPSSILYAVEDKERLRGKRLLIVGGGDTAADWAIQLADVAQSITLIHRRDVFRAHEDSVNQLLSSGATMKLFRELKALHGNGTLTGITVFDNRTKEEERIDADVLLVTIGFLADLGPIADWGIHVEKHAIVVDTTMATNLPGVFAAGDICTYAGKLRLIATAVGEAATAVNHAKHFLDPKAKVYPGHSSEMDKSVGVRIDENLLVI